MQDCECGRKVYTDTKSGTLPLPIRNVDDGELHTCGTSQTPKPRLREVTATNAETARADLIAAELLAEFGTPATYERAHTLIALAYLKGCQHELMWAKAKVGGEVA
jgi:hypothetical protein